MEVLGEALTELEELAPAGSEPVHERGEVVDEATGAAGSVAVPVVFIELEAGGVVVVQSVGPGAVYATEVTGHLKPRLFLLRTRYPRGRGSGG